MRTFWVAAGVVAMAAVHPGVTAAVSGVRAPAAGVTQSDTSTWCDDVRRNSDRDRELACEVRDFTVRAPRSLDILDNRNGSITVTGGSRTDVVIHALVAAQARTESDARALVHDVRVAVENGRVESSGPQRDDDEYWWVSYRVDAPRTLDLTLGSSNGSIAVTDVSGAIRATTSNGSVKLTGLSGDVRGETSNGSIQVDLTGHAWQGAGLDARTSNGAVHLRMPDDYSAHLEASTRNGSLSIDRPITVQGRIGRDIDATLGRGGATIHVTTSNGSVRISSK
jgi:Toastrack DUF4097